MISDDCSSPEAFAELERQVAGDPRFVVSRSPERLGFLRNFERAIALAARGGRADRPRRPGRPLGSRQARGRSLPRCAPTPRSLLAYSDVRIADADGNVLSDTYFFERRNNAESMASMLITNNVTGAASLFRRELLATALPFPPGGTGQELYHDHWLALCALATGPLDLRRPADPRLHAPRRLGDGPRGGGSLGRAAAGRLARRCRMRARRFARRLRLASRSPGWRSAYTGRYLLIRQLGDDPRAPARPWRMSRRVTGATSTACSPPSTRRRPPAGCWRRSFRPWIGRNDTLGRERVVFGGILWRKLDRGSTERRPRLRGRVAPTSAGSPLLALVLPVGGLAEAGGLDDLEAEHRALHPRRRDVDPEQVEDGLLRQPQQLLAGHADQLVGQQRGRGGRDRAALALEGDLGDPAVVVELDEDVLLVAAERVGVLELEVEGRRAGRSCAAACSARGSDRGRARPSLTLRPRRPCGASSEAVDQAVDLGSAVV